VTEIADYIDAFELLGDWDARYAYLMELGDRLPPMPQELKTEANRVKGCMSTVHVAAVRDAEKPDEIIYQGDCDTATIKGVVGILVELLSHKTPQQVLDTDVDSLFQGLNLEEHLSPSRHFGIYAIVEQMKQQAQSLAAAA
jgi:cysteine desulfuration protein SufE